MAETTNYTLTVPFESAPAPQLTRALGRVFESPMFSDSYDGQDWVGQACDVAVGFDEFIPEIERILVENGHRPHFQLYEGAVAGGSPRVHDATPQGDTTQDCTEEGQYVFNSRQIIVALRDGGEQAVLDLVDPLGTLR